MSDIFAFGEIVVLICLSICEQLGRLLYLEERYN